MQYLFYDTCALLDQSQAIFETKQYFLISSITLKELENIKTSAVKDNDIKYKARKVIERLSTNEQQFEIIIYQQDWNKDFEKYPVLSDNNDSKIILSAIHAKDKYPNDQILFVTQDYCCKEIAAAAGLEVNYIAEEDVPYKGWIEVKANNDSELEKIYTLIYSYPYKNPFNLLTNQYLLLKDQNNEIIDCKKFDGEGHIQVPFNVFSSKQFGKIKPKDKFQQMAMDSLVQNKITVLRGPAGSGKSFLSMGFLFSQYEQGLINKIIIFCNPVAAHGAARLGFYPGSKNDKLLDSQIGNFLASKLGDKIEVERLISQNVISLLPLADLRGFDTTGMKAGVYITEAQNLDIELMKLALQRIGEDCICILDGDSDTQVDTNLYAGTNNGLRKVSKVFRGESIYGEIVLPNIYRSQIASIAQKL